MKRGSLKNKKIIIFDLDGTLTESKQPLDTEMANLLRKLLHQSYVGLISGGSLTQFTRQFLASLHATKEELENLYLLPTSGAALYQNKADTWQPIYEVTLSINDIQRVTESLHTALSAVGLDTNAQTYGPLIEARGGQVTYSALGQSAPIQLKKAWDSNQEKRKKIVSELSHLRPDFDIQIGGTTSIDITKKGINKEYGIRKLLELLHIQYKDAAYVGDALFEGGNDEPALRVGIECVQVGTVDDTKKLIAEATTADAKVSRGGMLKNPALFAAFAIFLLAGIDTMLGGKRFADEFARWGYPLSALLYVGGAEIILSFLLIPKKSRLFAASALFLITFLGLIKHILSHDSLGIMIPGIVLVAVIPCIFLSKSK